jgi:hypothetical protein
MSYPATARPAHGEGNSVEYKLVVDTAHVTQNGGSPVRLAESLHELFVQRGISGKVAFHELTPMTRAEATSGVVC